MKEGRRGRDKDISIKDDRAADGLKFGRGVLKEGCNLTALGIRLGKLDRRGFAREGGNTDDRQTDSWRVRRVDGTLGTGQGTRNTGLPAQGPKTIWVSWGCCSVPQSS